MICDKHLYRNLRRTIGQNIRAVRTRQRMTLRKLALTTGVPVDRLDEYELGKGNIPLLDLLKIACALGLEVAGLVE